MKGAINIFESIKNQNNVNKNLAHSRLIKQTNLRQIQKKKKLKEQKPTDKEN